MRVCACVCVRVCVCVCVCAYVFVHVYMCLCMCVHMSVCVCASMCVHAKTYSSQNIVSNLENIVFYSPSDIFFSFCQQVQAHLPLVLFSPKK